MTVGYVGAGTVEFLYHPGDKTFAFLEVNTRLQVEHSITEATTDVDLVKAQIHVAGGGRLEGDRPTEKGHAVEARLNAEDPDRDFAPSPGRIVRLELPTGPGVRVDTGVTEGDTIPPDFDSMIAKIIAYAPTRAEALARLRRAMTETTVVIEGGACNKSFVLDLLDQPEVVDGTGGWADTSWIDRVRGEGRLVAQKHAGVAIVAAAIEAYVDELQIEVARLLETAHGGRPQAQHQAGRPVELKLRGTTYRVSTVNTGPARYRVTVATGADEQTVDVGMDRIDEFHRRLVVGESRYHVVTATHGPSTLVEVDGVAHRISRDEGGVLRSPAPALVVATPARVGDEVEAGCAGRRARVDEDGDGDLRAVRGPGQGAGGDHRQPGRDRRRAGQAGADRRRRRGVRPGGPGPAPRSTCRHRRPGSRPRCARPVPARRSPPSCSGTTSRRWTTGARSWTTSPPARSSGPRGCRSWPTRWPCSARWPTWPS